jgi:UDP-N-acetylglucosamine--N-acetylmuramyl-(pentapeptide) pyrophosphoryl-undecaprenol N-acetylglucosamine transferase
MGRANKALAPRVSAIAGGFLPEGEGAHAGKTVATGNPVRPAVIEAARSEYEQSGEGTPFRLLVFGGSQGAQFFSQAVPAAIALLPGELRARLHVTQQARAEDEAAVKAAYAGLGIAAEVSPFFTDMARRIAAAHLVVSRSGASTVSEIAAGRRSSCPIRTRSTTTRRPTRRRWRGPAGPKSASSPRFLPRCLRRSSQAS